jgi:hypothetical protein
MKIYRYSTNNGKTWDYFDHYNAEENLEIAWEKIKQPNTSISLECSDNEVVVVVIEHNYDEETIDEELELYTEQKKYNSSHVHINLWDYQKVLEDNSLIFVAKREPELIRRLELTIKYLTSESSEVFHHLKQTNVKSKYECKYHEIEYLAKQNYKPTTTLKVLELAKKRPIAVQIDASEFYCYIQNDKLTFYHQDENTYSYDEPKKEHFAEIGVEYLPKTEEGLNQLFYDYAYCSRGEYWAEDMENHLDRLINERVEGAE